MHYNRRFVGYFMGTYQAIMGGGSRWRSLPLPEAAGQRRHVCRERALGAALIDIAGRVRPSLCRRHQFFFFRCRGAPSQ